MNYKPSSWDLAVITPDSIAKASTIIEEKAKGIETKKKLLTNSITSKTFMNIIIEYESLRQKMEKLGIYAHLKFCENSNDQRAVAEMSQVESLLTKAGNRLLFLTHWFKKLPDEKAQELIDASSRYRYYFETLRKNKKFTLEENEEKIINIKDTTGSSALNTIYNILTSDFVFQFLGKKKTQEEMVTYVRSKDPKIREAAYKILLAPYKLNKTVIGEIYKNIINDWREENVALRGYKSPINVRNEVNDIPDEAIDVLLRVCKKNQHLFHKFFEIKRKKLGLKKLTRFDLYAPIEEEKGAISYDQAVKLVLKTFAEFSPVFKDCAEKIITKNHVHSRVQKGKRSGAFCCPATTQLPPFILLSYTAKYRDVSTLAHELGHGIHMTLSQGQTEFTMDACLPLAETASIFSEMLLSEKVMEDNPKAAKAMMFTKLDDLYASIIRQAGFVAFEIKAHQMMKEGKTVDQMSRVYLEDLRKQLGPVEVDEIFAYEWAYIPHIFSTPFYCYAYAFGNLLTLALYEIYKEDKKFSEKIIEMLAKGGSASPLEITKAIGVDITSEKFWQKGFDVIQKMIKKIEN
ncbi:MAG TPA: M3 family oligoendopeptidase [Candidatus Nanoarchaeia archaeon]|nr:M3 family oligoendopeptidase [Candidatus Nanoarchaeia archaeon]